MMVTFLNVITTYGDTMFLENCQINRSDWAHWRSFLNHKSTAPSELGSLLHSTAPRRGFHQRRRLAYFQGLQKLK